MRPPRVALFVANLQGLNGVAEYYRQILPHLQDSVDVVVVSTDPCSSLSDIFVRSRGVRAPWWTPEVDWLVPSTREIELALKSIRPDLVHVTDTNLLSVLALNVARRLGIPVIATCHTDLVGFVNTAYRNHHIARVASALPRYVYSRALSVATLGEIAASVLTRTIGIHTSSLRVIRPGVDPARFRPRDASQTRLGSRLRLLTVSRLSPEKRVDLVLDAHRWLAIDISPELWVVGRGPSSRKLQRHAAEHALFTGALVGEGLAQAYREADLFVLAAPSEMFPQVLLEAQASGLPCVVSPSGAARQAIDVGISGLIAEANSANAFRVAIRSILGSDKRRHLMGLAARNLAVRASWVRAAQDLASWYRQAHAEFVAGDSARLDRLAWLR